MTTIRLPTEGRRAITPLCLSLRILYCRRRCGQRRPDEPIFRTAVLPQLAQAKRRPGRHVARPRRRRQDSSTSRAARSSRASAPPSTISAGRRSKSQPQGDNQPFNQLLLQAPGVAQDSFGQLHVRGDHANLQFRLNGVILPEGINVFGQALQTRLANSVSLITGALPAQYGLRTAGIIDIQTKTGTLNPGGSFTLYGGSQSTFQPSAEWGGRVGQIDYYVTGEILHNAEGIENPAADLQRDPRQHRPSRAGLPMFRASLTRRRA